MTDLSTAASKGVEMIVPSQCDSKYMKYIDCVENIFCSLWSRKWNTYKKSVYKIVLTLKRKILNFKTKKSSQERRLLFFENKENLPNTERCNFKTDASEISATV